MTLTHLNPDQLHASPAFSQGVLADAGRTLYVGGQNGTDGQQPDTPRLRKGQLRVRPGPSGSASG